MALWGGCCIECTHLSAVVFDNQYAYVDVCTVFNSLTGIDFTLNRLHFQNLCVPCKASTFVCLCLTIQGISDIILQSRQCNPRLCSKNNIAIQYRFYPLMSDQHHIDCPEGLFFIS